MGEWLILKRGHNLKNVRYHLSHVFFSKFLVIFHVNSD